MASSVVPSSQKGSLECCAFKEHNWQLLLSLPLWRIRFVFPFCGIAILWLNTMQKNRWEKLACVLHAFIVSIIRINRHHISLSSCCVSKSLLFLYFTVDWDHTWSSAAVCNSLLNTVIVKFPMFALYISYVFLVQANIWLYSFFNDWYVFLK